MLKKYSFFLKFAGLDPSTTLHKLDKLVYARHGLGSLSLVLYMVSLGVELLHNTVDC